MLQYNEIEVKQQTALGFIFLSLAFFFLTKTWGLFSQPRGWLLPLLLIETILCTIKYENETETLNNAKSNQNMSPINQQNGRSCALEIHWIKAGRKSSLNLIGELTYTFARVESKRLIKRWRTTHLLSTVRQITTFILLVLDFDGDSFSFRWSFNYSPC